MRNIEYAYKNFTASKIKRFLKIGGTDLVFRSFELNEFKEPIRSQFSEIHVFGIVHRVSAISANSQAAFHSTTTKDSHIRSSSSTCIYTSWESIFPGYIGGKDLKPGMKITLNDIAYQVIRCENLNELNIACEIYLEEYDGWT